MLLIEAKSLYCPFIKALCIADKCMAWKPKSIYSDSTGRIAPLIKIGESKTSGDCSLKKS